MGRNCIILIFLLSVLSAKAQTNRALIVAISDYPVENGWDETHAVNDCDIVAPMLISCGYKKNNIKMLLNEHATKMNIVKELELLQKNSGKGDYIYIHFSGHGQQMADDNGDEADFLDEAFIPYDAYYRYVKGRYEGENHLRDDELEVLIDNIRIRIGCTGNVMVVMDACHSGTGTRVTDEEDYIRGTSYIFAPDNFKPVYTGMESFNMNLKSGKELASVTVFSACQPNELNYEYRTGFPVSYYGSLSFFFCKSVKERMPLETNSSFFLRLKKEMSTYFKGRKYTQTPYFESTDENKRFIIGR